MPAPVIYYGPRTFAGITIDIQPGGGIAAPIYWVTVNGHDYEADTLDEVKAIIAQALGMTGSGVLYPTSERGNDVIHETCH